MLAITNALYRQLILSSQTVLCVTDKNREIQLINPAFTNLYCCEQKEIEGKFSNFLDADRSVYFENGVYKGEYERLFRRLQRRYTWCCRIWRQKDRQSSTR